MQNSFFMQKAIKEALKADPNKVYPNPLVGCVIVKNDKIITNNILLNYIKLKDQNKSDEYFEISKKN